MDLKEGKLDLEELKVLLSQSKRPNVQELLKKQIRHIEVEEKLAEEEQERKSASKPVVESEKEPLSQTNEPNANLKFITLQRYTFDQTDSFVNVQVYLDNVSEANPSNVQVTFKEESFEIKVIDLKGINYKFMIAKLMDKIKPADCKFIIKKSYISIKLKVAQKSSWSSLAYKEDLLKKSKEPSKGKSDNPQDSLMDMMKNLYETGDDKMKETIAKSFAQSRSGQGMDSKMNPMGMGMGGDFGEDF